MNNIILAIPLYNIIIGNEILVYHLFTVCLALVLHGALGIAYPYGNSNILPFEKRYFSGGANSVRGWSVRSLGPGGYQGADGRINFINQTGDMRLDLNAEWRTYLFWKFNGALFIDAGNIWTLREYKDQPGGQFKFSTFLSQIAASYGLGLRLNFDYFILIRPIIDKGMERAESGSRGGKAAKHRKGSLEATFGTNESEKDKEKDMEQEEDKDKDVESMFAEFWSAYPRKDAKKSARKVFLRIVNDADDPDDLLAQILDAITLAKRSYQWQKDDGQFIPLPATWLNQERWEDSGVSETLEEPTDEDRTQKLTNFADTLLDERN